MTIRLTPAFNLNQPLSQHNAVFVSYLSNLKWIWCVFMVRLLDIKMAPTAASVCWLPCLVCKFTSLLWYKTQIVNIVLICIIIFLICFLSIFHFLSMLLGYKPDSDSPFRLIIQLCSCCSNSYHPREGTSAQHYLPPAFFMCFKGQMQC